MSDHSYTIEKRRIWMTLPYGSPIKGRIKDAGAHWDSASKRWWIGTVAKDIVLPIMQEAMGELDDAEMVTVKVDLDAARHLIDSEGGATSKYALNVSMSRSLTLDGIPLATWNGHASNYKERTGQPRVSEFVLVTRGRIEGVVGGSRRHPAPYITWDDGTVIRIEVAAPVAQRWIEEGIAAPVEASAA